MLKNCINCGAILHGTKCEYCGTEYPGIENKNCFYTIRIGNKNLQCYIGDIEQNTIIGDAYRDCNGRLHRGEANYKHKITLIEV